MEGKVTGAHLNGVSAPQRCLCSHNVAHARAFDGKLIGVDRASDGEEGSKRSMRGNCMVGVRPVPGMGLTLRSEAQDDQAAGL